MKDPIRLLENAIEDQNRRMRGYEVASEAITFETLRAIDFAYCRELFPELAKMEHGDMLAESIRRRGVNAALRRVMPKEVQREQPRLFRSNKRTAEQADDFLLDAGMLDLAERQLELVRAGVLEAQIVDHKVMGLVTIVLSPKDATAYREQIGGHGLSWISERTVKYDHGWEQTLEDRHRQMLPLIVESLQRRGTDDDFPFDDVDRYFQEWAVLYLRRMAFVDLLADEDRIGGKRYSDYVATLVALSTLSQQRLCYAGLMNAGDSSAGVRNLLTGGAIYTELVEAVAHSLDGTTEEIELLLDHLSLAPKSMEAHLRRGTPAFAPIVRTNEHFCILPSYGLEMNPFVFLFNELRERYEDDWFKLVNKREPRWVNELLHLFTSPRWTCRNGLKLKRNGRMVTDIDFVAYDHDTRALLLFQLKWQQAAVNDERVRRNNASNLVSQCNNWVDDLHTWIDSEGVENLKQRLGLKDSGVASFHAIVLGRYDAHFTGEPDQDGRAVWSDWGNFLRMYQQQPDCSAIELVDGLRKAMEKATSEVRLETRYLLLPSLALLVNPIKA